ncbi:hypothetical protein IFM58399_07298 [Aspergillus lentulus]|uniref:alpha/beta hydrolase n=1 Tax=Aspergillus lentulus TaxID=293939 RepID=UPI0013926A57|nr:uncharacterized protein IFM58399_07298 [Aspergillus lentulus]GFF44459.1 hypothetical protein IFM58399_07298 [Aspergillus lentulus]GFF64321.1 hypothetical protein IFM62136_05924 [Aspergillus lentulus]GFG15344.1 hypothetical protein IFM61392_08928 [Aspergillus lentulus]
MATIVFVPGAWITPDFYQPFLDALTKAGYPVRYAGYPSLDPADPTSADCKADSDAIASVIRPLVEDEARDVLLVMHSYAGMPGAAAAKGLAKTERMQQGKSGGIVGMVFIAAFLVPEGLSCAGLQGGYLPPWILLDKPYDKVNIPDDPAGIFAADFDQGVAQNLAGYIQPHSTLAFNSPQPAPAWADQAYAGRLAFIVSTLDKALPEGAQRAMMTATQKDWIVEEMVCSHCAPFVTRVAECVRLLQGFLGLFEGMKN